MSEYEVTFIVSPMSEAIEDKVFEAYDCVSGETHGGQHFITLTAKGPDAVEAIKRAAFDLAVTMGVEIDRIDFDLAARGELAYRLDKTPQAVGLWTRGERHSDNPFPERFSDVAGGVWLWGDVVGWVREVLHEDPAPGLLFPTRAEIDEANACIRRDYAEAAKSQFALHLKAAPMRAHTHVVPFRVSIDALSGADWLKVLQDANEETPQPTVMPRPKRVTHRD